MTEEVKVQFLTKEKVFEKIQGEPILELQADRLGNMAMWAPNVHPAQVCQILFSAIIQIIFQQFPQSPIVKP